jgi:hypothetical protein
MQGAPVLLPKHSEEDVSITIWDRHANEANTLQVLPACKAHKTLGHYKDPAGTQSEQFRQLKKKSDSITAFLWESPPHPLGSMDILLCMFLARCELPLSELVPHKTTSRTRLEEGYINYCAALRFQPQHEEGDPVWTTCLGRSEFPVALCPTGGVSSDDVHSTMAHEFYSFENYSVSQSRGFKLKWAHLTLSWSKNIHLYHTWNQNGSNCSGHFCKVSMRTCVLIPLI